MKIEKIRDLFEIKKGEEPKTRFVDNIEAVKVELIDWPDQERLKRVFVNMSQASWFEDFYSDASKSDRDEIVEDLFSGKILGQSMEHPQFAFKVSGLSLHGTHALVRNRIGIAYLQQSQAVKDFRHSDVLVPRAFTKHRDLLEKYEMWVQQGKQLYADMLDTGDIANTDARFCLPKTIPSWIYVSAALPTILSIYGKRTDSQEEHPEMNAMAYQMRDLIVEKFPYMRGYFVSHDDNGRCLHLKKGYAANCIFKRDEKHEIDGYEDEWTLHDKTKQELMLDAERYDPKGVYYVGKRRFKWSDRRMKPNTYVILCQKDNGKDWELRQATIDPISYCESIRKSGRRAYVCGKTDSEGIVGEYEIRY
jgi:thymidylate synthase ThyX